jgi:membrane protein DedA with SNARE-associated domain
VIHLDERRIKLGLYLFQRYGGWVVFFGRFVPVLRAWAAFLAGTNCLPWNRFFVFNAVGGIVWSALYGLGGYLLGANVYRLTGPLGIALGVLAVLILGVGLVALKRNEHKLEEEATQALPGPLDGQQSSSSSSVLGRTKG